MTQPPPLVGQGRRPATQRPWPRLPRWFVAGTAAGLALFLAVVTVAVVAVLRFKTQPLYERRSPSAPGEMSHNVGRVVLPVGQLHPVACGSVTGLRVLGGPDSTPLLAAAIGGLCRRLPALGPLGPHLADRIVTLAKAGAIVSFANFGRTGELTTTLAGTPPRVLLNDAFLRGGGQFKGFLLPELAHELWHGGATRVTAVDELEARRIELAACAVVPGSAGFRGCTDAKRIVGAGTDAALRGLRAAGYE